MSSKQGFTLVEAVVAVLIAAFVVIAVGGLVERLLHHRTTTDSNSAAQSLALWQMEKLFADANPNPPVSPDCPNATTASNICGTATTNGANLCGNTTASGRQHGPFPVDVLGNASTSTGPYCIQWNVIDTSTSASSPLVIPSASTATKRITVTVRHLRNPLVNARAVTQYPSP